MADEISDDLKVEERRLRPLNLDQHFNISKSWADGFEKQRNKDFNERRQRRADVLAQTESTSDIPEDPRDRVLTDDRIEDERQKTMVSLIRSRVRDSNWGPGRLINRQHKKFGVWHIWFEENDFAKSALRKGNPPADVDRPSFLKGKRLEIDLDPIPQDAWDFVTEYEEFRRVALARTGPKQRLHINKTILGMK